MVIEKEQERAESGAIKKPKRFVIVFVVLLLILGSLFYLAQRTIYHRPPGDTLVTFLAAAYPFPAVKIGSMTITMKDYLIEYKAFESSLKAAEGQEPPAPEQLQEVILQTLINKRVIAKLAKDFDVKATPERVDAYYKQALADQKDEQAFAQELQTTFGWTIDEFKKRVIESIVLAVDTNIKVLASEDLQAERKALITTARTRVQNNEDFATVAKEVMGPFGLMESDLGFFKISALPEEWRSAVDATQKEALTDVLQNDKIFTFFKIKDRIVAGDETQVHLLTITIPKKTLEDLVKEYLATVEVKRYLGT